MEGGAGGGQEAAIVEGVEGGGGRGGRRQWRAGGGAAQRVSGDMIRALVKASGLESVQHEERIEQQSRITLFNEATIVQVNNGVKASFWSSAWIKHVRHAKAPPRCKLFPLFLLS